MYILGLGGSGPEAGNEGDSSSSRLLPVSESDACVARSAPPVRYYGVLAFNSSWTPHSQLSRGLRRRTCAARPSVRVMVGRAAPASPGPGPAHRPWESNPHVACIRVRSRQRAGCGPTWAGGRAPLIATTGPGAGGRPCPYVLAPFASCVPF